MIQLRDYQARATDEIRAAFGARHRAVLFVLGTGGGKTVVFGYIAEQAAAKGKRVLILAHRRELIRQASRKLREAGVEHGIIAPGFTPNRELVQVASVQTLAKRLDQMPQFDIIIVDEAHHSVAGQWDKVIQAQPQAKLLGVTATPERLDGKGLGVVAGGPYQHMVLGPPVSWLIEKTHLTPSVVYAPSEPPDLSGVRIKGGDYAADQLEERINVATITGDVVAHWKRLAPGLPTIAFCISVQHAQDVADTFRRAGVRAVCGHGGMTPAERDAAIGGLEAGSVQVLTTCDLVSEGLDVPAVGAVILLRPTKSLGLYLQQCLDSHTEILTERGWAGQGQVKPSDLVAAWNAETEAVEWCPIDEIIRRPLGEGEEMFAIRSPHLDIRVTGGHEVVVRCRSVTSKRWRKEPAEAVSQRKEMIHIPVSGVENVPPAPITDDEISFLGWFLTDGTRNKINNSIAISQSAAKEDHCAEIRRVLSGCGFKFGEHRAVRRDKMAGYPDLIRFSVSFGKPRGRDKHLRGWGSLDAWADKGLPAIYNTLDARQIGVLLAAMNLGDGANGRKTLTWTARTMTITTGDSERLADRLQALCVRRGFRANKAVSLTPGKSPQFFLHIKKVRTSTIAGAGCKNGTVLGKPYARSRLARTDCSPGELVWCVRNRLGTLVTRRSGKVSIVGNCGRGLRPAPGKQHLVVLDHAGCTVIHGFVDDPRGWSLAGKKKGAKAPPTWQCPSCFAIQRPAKVCTACGFEVPKPEAGRGKGREIVHADGELVMMDRARVDAIRATKLSELLTGRETRQQLEEIARAKGYKPSWVYFTLRERRARKVAA